MTDSYSIIARPGLGVAIEQPRSFPSTAPRDLQNLLTD